MINTKILFSLIGILAVIALSYFWYEQENQEKLLRSKHEFFQADIIELRCATKDYITFKLKGKEVSQRIYLSSEECNVLKKQKQIAVKVDDKNNVVFANDNYNDSAEFELAAIILLAIFIIYTIYYYGIKPEIKTTHNTRL